MAAPERDQIVRPIPESPARNPDEARRLHLVKRRQAILPLCGSLAVFKDNLFDKVAFWQDPTLPLDHDHNGYWRRTSGELNPDPDPVWGIYDTDRLGDSTGGTINQSTDVLVTAAPAYIVSTYGDKYLNSTAPTLVAMGSRTPADAGLYHYTTKTTQTKDASQTAVNIGLHYVASVSSKASDVDNDGIPDYVENWHGDGDTGANRVHTADETDWQNATTATDPNTSQPIADANNVIYDDIDLDGDGMVGRIEKALGTQPLVADNPFVLQQVTSGKEPDVLAFTVPLNHTFLTNLGAIEITVDGNRPRACIASPGGDGNTSIHWNTTFSGTGKHVMSAQFRLRDLPSPDGKPLGTFAVQSPLLLSPSDNVLQFDQFYSTFHQGDGGDLYARLAVPSADYTISLYDAAAAENTPAFRVYSASASTSEIRVFWDGNDSNGSQFAGDTVRAVFEIHQPNAPPEQHTRGYQAGQSLTSCLMACLQLLTPPIVTMIRAVRTHSCRPTLLTRS